MLEVARTIGASPFTYSNWENGRTTPALRWHTLVHTWLGYCPLHGTGASLAERLRRWRYGHGFSLRAAAELAGLDAGTLGRAEGGVDVHRRSEDQLRCLLETAT